MDVDLPDNVAALTLVAEQPVLPQVPYIAIFHYCAERALISCDLAFYHALQDWPTATRKVLPAAVCESLLTWPFANAIFPGWTHACQVNRETNQVEQPVSCDEAKKAPFDPDVNVIWLFSSSQPLLPTQVSGRISSPPGSDLPRCLHDLVAIGTGIVTDLDRDGRRKAGNETAFVE